MLQHLTLPLAASTGELLDNLVMSSLCQTVQHLKKLKIAESGCKLIQFAYKTAKKQKINKIVHNVIDCFTTNFEFGLPLFLFHTFSFVLQILSKVLSIGCIINYSQSS